MKKQFLESEFGKGLISTITDWDQALEKSSRIGEDKEILRTLAWCQAQWEVYRKAIKNFYGVEYHFTRTDEYYGLCTEDESDWLMKVDRELASCNKPAPDADIDDVIKAIIAGVESHLQICTSEFSVQKVTRRGIKIAGVEYWDDHFVHANLGKQVIVEADPWLIRVYTACK